MTDLLLYDPTIQALLAQCEDDWGNPVLNKSRLIPYGILPLDMGLYGIDPEGELVIIQGEEKNRKTTLVTNVIANYMTAHSLKEKPVTNIDTLETGMKPNKYRDTFISIMASRHLINAGGHRPNSYCPACGGECTQLQISPKFLRYNSRSTEQQRAIEYAMDLMEGWPLLIHGAAFGQGNTRSLSEAAIGSKKMKARWQKLVDEYGMKILVIDHVQQYMFSDDPSDYEKQIRAVGAIGDFVAQNNVACLMLSQVSLWSARDAKQNGGMLVAAGGKKAAQEANTVLSTRYKSGSGVMRIKIEESRHAGSYSVWQRLEDVSGTFYGDATTEPLSEE
jgi:hypothetical protein